MGPIAPSPSAAARRLALSLLLLAPIAAQASEYERPIERAVPGGAVRAVTLENLAGRVELVAAAGDAVRVTGTVHAERSAGRTARELGESLEIAIEQQGDRLLVRAIYPLDDHRRFHYPQPERAEESWLLDWIGVDNSTVRYQGRDVRVAGRPSAGAATLWASFRLELPAGVSVLVKNAIGGIESTGVQGDQSLDGSTGPIRARGGRGELRADTGSGDVRIEDHQGDVFADTGSGDVILDRVRGETIAADTGSGDVELVDCSGSLDADTGSGEIVTRNLTAGRELRADTGSGDVRIEGDLTATRRIDIDTGSGDVELRIAGAPSLRLILSTGSGEIDLDLDAARLRRARRGDYVAELGAGEGDGQIDTGSGDVRISGR